ncbi:MAG: hypothetical protein R3A47_07060 [Polyangiales bacterium]
MPETIAQGGTPDAWIRKPFDPTDLVAQIRELALGSGQIQRKAQFG